MKIDWQEVEEYRSLGLTWIHIAEVLGIKNANLLYARKKVGFTIQPPGNCREGKKMCSVCRHLFDKDKLIRTRKGAVCPLCFRDKEADRQERS